MSLRLGIRANLAQFSLLVAVNALVGGVLGQERTVLPLLAEQTFHLTGYTFLLTYVFAFGVTKAATNYVAGTFSDRYGRKPVLLAGWLVAIPVPLMLIWAPSWGWVVAANVLLGVNQGLTWSTTVIMKIDLAGPERRGLAMGLNEAAGYLAVAGTALATGYLAAAHGLRPAPFLLGLSYVALGLGLSALVVHETRGHAQLEATRHTSRADLTDKQVFVQTSVREPALSAASQAGMVNNLNDGLAWGLFPILFATAGLSVSRIGILAAVYPAVWGIGQLITGPLSDRWGRKHLITAGMFVQAAALALVAIADTFPAWVLAAVLLGAGTALVYPTLLATIGDVAHPAWRARAVGVYRLWRDGGFAVGAVLAGIVADLWGLRAAVWVVAAITAASGVIVAVRMYETHTRRGEPELKGVVTIPSGLAEGTQLPRRQRHHPERRSQVDHVQHQSNRHHTTPSNQLFINGCITVEAV
ncbi:MFS transporter [Actinophytocola sp.]|uniref:MFS transporter n=1 Tax=Actinophytocola sp. TaxID=1872138 RepID=UPI0025C54CFE|nr:MFS transporter [Actinophytocola sp.]